MNITNSFSRSRINDYIELIGGELALAHFDLTDKGDAAMLQFFGHSLKEIATPTLQGIPLDFRKLEAATHATLMPSSKLESSTTPTNEEDESEEAVIVLLKGMDHIMR